MRELNFPLIFVQTYQQGKPFSAYCDSEEQLWEFAYNHVNKLTWEWPGHRSDPNDEDSEWVDDSTVQDALSALASDTYGFYIAESKEEYQALYKALGSQHQGYEARALLKKNAQYLGWEPWGNEADDDDDNEDDEEEEEDAGE